MPTSLIERNHHVQVTAQGPKSGRVRIKVEASRLVYVFVTNARGYSQFMAGESAPFRFFDMGLVRNNTVDVAVTPGADFFLVAVNREDGPVAFHYEFFNA